MPERSCPDCGADLSGRHPNAKRCEACSWKRVYAMRLASNREYYRRNRDRKLAYSKAYYRRPGNAARQLERQREYEKTPGRRAYRRAYSRRPEVKAANAARMRARSKPPPLTEVAAALPEHALDETAHSAASTLHPDIAGRVAKRRRPEAYEAVCRNEFREAMEGRRARPPARVLRLRRGGDAGHPRALRRPVRLLRRDEKEGGRVKKDLPITIDWDAQWPSEFLFQHIACWLIRHCTPRVHALDTSRLAAPGRGTPDNVEAPSQHGAPDIVACVDGDYVTIELKSARGRAEQAPGPRAGPRHGGRRPLRPGPDDARRVRRAGAGGAGVTRRQIRRMHDIAHELCFACGEPVHAERRYHDRCRPRMSTYTIRLRDGREFTFWTRSFACALQILWAEIGDEVRDRGMRAVAEGRRGGMDFAAIESVTIDPPLPDGTARWEASA